MSVESFKPILWAAALDAPFQDALVYSQTGVANARFQPVLQNSGKSVKINRLGAVETRTYTQGEAITYDTLSTEATELVMDQQEYYAFLIEDIDDAQAAGDFQNESTRQHAYAMAAKVDAHTAGVLKDGAKTKLGNKAVFDGADFYRPAEGQMTAWDVLREFSKQLNKNSAPSLDRWVVVGPNMAAALLADRRFTEADKAGTDTILRNGQIGSVPTLGFTVYTSNQVPVTAGRETLIGGAPNALDFASQLQTAEAFRHQDYFADAFRGLQVWGSALAYPESVVTLEADVKPGTLGSAPAAAA